MPDLDFNLIRFTVQSEAGLLTAAWLQLDGEFVVTAGVKPNVATFITTAVEFAKLSDIDVEGNLEFYFKTPGDPNSTPLRWDRMKIVDVEIAEWGTANNDQGAVRPQTYRLQIADARHQFESPRGGRLINGEINKLPFDDDSGTDANGNALVNNKELAEFCLRAMGLSISAPASLSDTTAIKDIEWRGNHAPTELAKILDELGYAFIIKQGGDFSIVKIGVDSGELPEADAVIPGGMAIPSLDRRGKRVVFSSYPTPAMNTINVTSLDAQGFELVCPDKDGKWKPLADAIATFTNLSPANLVRNHFADLPQEQRALLAAYMYRCLRLNSTKFPRVRLYRELHQVGKVSTGFEISAKIAIADANGAWSASDDLVRLTPTLLLTPPGSGSIIVVRELIGTVGSNSTVDPEADFKEIGKGDIKAKITIEAVEQDGSGPWHTKYFFVGFDADGQLDASAAKTAMSLPDAVVVSRPDLQLMQVDGTDKNFDDLASTCAAMADRYLAAGGDSKLHIYRGFPKVNLSGRINEIRISQTPPMTKIKEQTWWLPQGHYLRQVKESRESAAAREGFPNQGKSEAQRLAQGVAGATQPAVPIAPESRVVPGRPHGVVRIDSRNTSGGPTVIGGAAALGGAKYMGTIINGATTVGKDASQFKKLDGMTDGPAALVINLGEISDAASHWCILGFSAQPTYANYELRGRTDDGTAIVTVCVPNPHAVFYVALTKDDGGNGDNGTKASYGYTVKTLAGDVLGTKVPPEMPRDFGPATPATSGLAYWDFERRFHLVWAFEIHSSGGCP